MQKKPTNKITFWCHGEHYFSKGRINVLSLEGLISSENALSADSELLQSHNISLMPSSYSKINSGGKATYTRNSRETLLSLQSKNDVLLNQIMTRLLN